MEEVFFLVIIFVIIMLLLDNSQRIVVLCATILSYMLLRREKYAVLDDRMVVKSESPARLPVIPRPRNRMDIYRDLYEEELRYNENVDWYEEM